MQKHFMVMRATYAELEDRVSDLTAERNRMKAALEKIVARGDLTLNVRLSGSANVSAAYDLANEECAAIAEEGLGE